MVSPAGSAVFIVVSRQFLFWFLLLLSLCLLLTGLSKAGSKGAAMNNRGPSSFLLRRQKWRLSRQEERQHQSFQRVSQYDVCLRSSDSAFSWL